MARFVFLLYFSVVSPMGRMIHFPLVYFNHEGQEKSFSTWKMVVFALLLNIFPVLSYLHALKSLLRAVLMMTVMSVVKAGHQT